MADQAEAEKVKSQGNAAFSAGKLEEAVRLFTRCIELDASNHIYYSNRAAAQTGLKNYTAAARDARQCTELKPRWAKGWSRLGAAYFGLEDFAEVQLGRRCRGNEQAMQGFISTWLSWLPAVAPAPAGSRGISGSLQIGA